MYCLPLCRQVARFDTSADRLCGWLCSGRTRLRPRWYRLTSTALIWYTRRPHTHARAEPPRAGTLLLGTVAQTSDIEVLEEGSEEEWAYMRVVTTHGYALRLSGGRTEMVVRLLPAPPPYLSYAKTVVVVVVVWILQHKR